MTLLFNGHQLAKSGLLLLDSQKFKLASAVQEAVTRKNATLFAFILVPLMVAVLMSRLPRAYEQILYAHTAFTYLYALGTLCNFLLLWIMLNDAGLDNDAFSLHPDYIPEEVRDDAVGSSPLDTATPESPVSISLPDFAQHGPKLDILLLYHLNTDRSFSLLPGLSENKSLEKFSIPKTETSDAIHDSCESHHESAELELVSVPLPILPPLLELNDPIIDGAITEGTVIEETIIEGGAEFNPVYNTPSKTGVSPPRTIEMDSTSPAAPLIHSQMQTKDRVVCADVPALTAEDRTSPSQSAVFQTGNSSSSVVHENREYIIISTAILLIGVVVCLLMGLFLSVRLNPQSHLLRILLKPSSMANVQIYEDSD